MQYKSNTTYQKATLTPEQKVAKKKFLSNKFIFWMVEDLQNQVPEKQLKYYWDTYHCMHVIKWNPIKEKNDTYHCWKRHCLICNSIKTAKLIFGYLSQIETMETKYFITLTAKSVEQKDIKNRIEKMQKYWRQIMTKSTRQKLETNGIRKLELNVTHDGKYHIHYHLITQSNQSAEFIKNEWLSIWKRNFPNQLMASPDAQKIKIADNNLLMELFKYVIKIVSDTSKTQKDKLNRIVNATPMQRHKMYQALKNKRTIQPFGNIKKIEVEKPETSGLQPTKKQIGKLWFYEQKISDWVSEHGELLTGYEPSKQILKKATQSIKFE